MAVRPTLEACGDGLRALGGEERVVVLGKPTETARQRPCLPRAVVPLAAVCAAH